MNKNKNKKIKNNSRVIYMNNELKKIIIHQKQKKNVSNNL
jgi:hypothetical protein